MAESDAIMARLATLAGGRVEEGLTDDMLLARYAVSGVIKPYINVQFGAPIPSPLDRGMGVGEDKQPYVLAFTVECYGADSRTARLLAVAVRNLLINWEPNGTNANPIKGSGGYSYTRPIEQSKPTRFEEGCFFVVTINQSTA
jgi:hypothetical protein